ncbi:MAG: type VI secretion system tip protein VgrG [Planctomycetota bacterium]
MALKQQNRLLNLNTALGEDVLLLTSFNGSEEMGRLFRYHLGMISDDNAIQPQDIVGTGVTWNVELADGSRRHWHGFVNQFARGDVGHKDRRNYSMEVVPWFWFLTQTSDCKIFQDTDVPKIIDEVLADFGFADYVTDFQLDHKPWEYCVQYRETDFSFLSRLMEQEGIFYYFKHSDGGHQMVITDHKDGYYTLPESEVDFPDDVGTRAMEDHLTSWERRFQFVPGKYSQTDYDFKKPSTDLGTNTGTVVDLPEIGNYELYDYPGEYIEKSEGDVETKVRIEVEETRHDIVSATSLCKTFQVGGRFQVQQHRDSAEEGAEVVITAIHHAANEPMAYESGGDSLFHYRNSLTCLPSSRVYRTARNTSKPVISGIQTAVVTGPPSEEIYPDEFGRVKCQFHWDRYGEKNENSSCWIRVSQSHAGVGFGSISIPRIGEEVVVSFLEGDPDRPLITGRVYHAQNMPPYSLPEAKNICGVKTNSTKGGGGFNEFKMDDTKDKELVTFHAQKDLDSTVEHNETRLVRTGTQSVTVKGDTSLTVQKGQRSVRVLDNTYDLAAKKAVKVFGETEGVMVTGDGKGVNITGTAKGVVVTGKPNVDLFGSEKMSLKSPLVEVGDKVIKVNGTEISIVGKTSITLTVGSNGIKIDNMGVSVNGTMIKSVATGTHDIKGALVKIN